MGTRSSIAVIGGGLVGACAALSLAQTGFAITLIDRQRPRLSTGILGIDIRNVALSPASRQLLEKVGAFAGVPSAAYRSMCIWEQWGSGQIHFQAADVGRQELGWLVETSPLTCAAWARLDELDNVEVLLDTLADVAPDETGVSLQFDLEPLRRFDFLIAADGAQSFVRQALALKVVTQALDQTALATVVRTTRSHQHTAWQRFLTEGPLAFLPTTDEHLCSIVWSQSKASVARRLVLDDDAFCAEIGHAIEHRLGEVTAVDQRMAFPLTQQQVTNCAPHARVLLVGDAMRVVHPLAGLGVNLGLEDVSQLLKVACRHTDLAAPGIWQRYARQRQLRSQMMIQTMAALQRLFSSTNPAVSLLRNLGVESFNALDGLKRQVMREAMGLGALSGP